MKPGRNDPCPCGSGKKYKKCCLPRDSGATPEHNTLRVVQGAMQELSMRLWRSFHQTYGDKALEEAWSAFALWPEEDELEPFDPELPEADTFTNWLMFTWAPDPAETVVTDEALHGVVPAQTHLSRRDHQLTPIQQEYLQSCIDAYWSFYRVERTERDQRLTLRDMLTGMSREIYAPAAAGSLQVGDEAYGYTVTVAGVRLIGSLEPVSFMGQEMEALEVLRERIASAATDATPEALEVELRRRDDEVRELYLLLNDILLHPIVLQSGHNGSDALLFHELIFDIDSPQLALDALQRFQPDDTEPPALAHDAAGHAHATLLCCDPDTDADTPEEERMLGTIDIDDATLTVETSMEHAAQIRDIIETALGEHVRLREETTQEIDDVLDSMANDPDLMASLDDEDAEDEYEILQQVYTAWMDARVPELDERTPRECVQSLDGRRHVAALLDAAQADVDTVPDARLQTLFDGIRKELGLLDPTVNDAAHPRL